ncbi:MAG: hypothetical protein A3F17_01010 [Gammaproteobacteria bacterium RIFCSPHIGHO2_12_FULL_41_15]|nr:MAG: hypothetical protein A3F17_01010 [Gammaproteobacteria bacterium RIFCSPHIGHO2_12_FULL_41_15]
MPLLICPNCHVEMHIVSREDIEMDVCTNCQGVWLDKGELEKLVTIAVENSGDKKKDAHRKNKHRRFWDNILDIFK